jgi:glycine oxidase
MILIIGGGIAGLAIGWRLAQTGEQVTVLEKERVGRGASWAAAGILFPESKKTAFGALTAVSHSLWPDFVTELEDLTNMSLDYRRHGDIFVVFPDDEADLRARYQRYTQFGWAVEWLTGAEVRQREPKLSPDITAGLFNPMTHQVNNRLVVQALAQALVQAGGVLREATAVTKLLITHNQVQGVRLADGTDMGADVVILAAGAWSAQLAGLPPDCVPPVQPVKGHMLALQTERPLLHHMIRRQEGSLVSRANGRLIVGATLEPEAGFDTAVYARTIHKMLQDAERYVPGILDLPLAETWTGFRPGTPDEMPILGPTAVPNLFLATGQYMDGILLAPIMAQTITELVQTGVVPELIQPFGIGRFQ